MTVFAAAPGHAAGLRREWRPHEGDLQLELGPLPSGGAAILSETAGHLPGLRGRLNPMRDTADRACLYADGIAIDEGREQPVPVRLGRALRLTDAHGAELVRHHRRHRRPRRAGRIPAVRTLSRPDPTPPAGEVVVYEAPDGDVQVDVRLDQETVWLSQRSMAAVFATTTENVRVHLQNVFASGELDAAATSKDYLVVRTEGARRVRRRIRHYSLDAIISVGYRVNSKRGVRFRQWATRTLRDHMVRGYTLNERRLAERGSDEAREALALLSRSLRTRALADDTEPAPR